MEGNKMLKLQNVTLQTRQPLASSGTLPAALAAPSAGQLDGTYCQNRPRQVPDFTDRALVDGRLEPVRICYCTGDQNCPVAAKHLP